MRSRSTPFVQPQFTARSLLPRSTIFIISFAHSSTLSRPLERKVYSEDFPTWERVETLSLESRREQSKGGMRSLGQKDVALLRDYNQRYRHKFGFPFVICARLNNKETILSGVQTRLNNEKSEELETGIVEVKKIMLLRMKDLVFSGASKLWTPCWDWPATWLAGWLATHNMASDISKTQELHFGELLVFQRRFLLLLSSWWLWAMVFLVFSRVLPPSLLFLPLLSLSLFLSPSLFSPSLPPSLSLCFYLFYLFIYLFYFLHFLNCLLYIALRDCYPRTQRFSRSRAWGETRENIWSPA